MEFRETSELGNDDSEPPEHPFQVHVANQQSALALDESKLAAAVQSILRDSHFHSASISLAVVDDPTIHDLNRQYLEHDYPTDVLSFPLEDDGIHLTGELIVSADTAQSNAAEYGWSPVNELMLYVVHGTLHLVGYRDKQAEEAVEMREAEQSYLARFDITVPVGHLKAVEEST